STGSTVLRSDAMMRSHIDQVVAWPNRRPRAGRQDDGGCRLLDDGGTGNGLAGRQVLHSRDLDLGRLAAEMSLTDAPCAGHRRRCAARKGGSRPMRAEVPAPRDDLDRLSRMTHGE